MSGLFIYYLIFLFIVLFFLIVYFATKNFKRKKVLSQLQFDLFSVELPVGTLKPEDKENPTDLKKEINVFEQFLSSLFNFNKEFVLEVAVPHVGEEIRFYVAVHLEMSEVLVKTINALWPEASVKKVEDYNIFNSQGAVSGGFVKQKERHILPIRTYQEIDGDTFLPILGGLTKVDEVGEGGAIQLIVRPAKRKEYRKEITSCLDLLKKGTSLNYLLKSPLSLEVKDFVEALKGEDKKQEKGNESKIVDELAVKALEQKLAKPFFEVNLRVLTSAATQKDADLLFASLTEGLAQFGTFYRNSLKIIKPKNLNDLVYNFSFRLFDESQKMVLNSEEISSLFHFPVSSTKIPKLKILKSRQAPPPSNLPEKGLLLGVNVFRGEEKEIRITDNDRRRHIYIIGQTGTGKSNLITNMAVQDIKNNKGLAVIDPHGDLVDHIVGLVPVERFDDVIYLNPGDIERPVGLNMLEYDFNRPEEKTFIVNELVNIFDKLYDLKVTGGPMFEQYMRNALLLLMEDALNEPATLIEVPRVFADSDFRRRKLERISNPIVIDFWEKEAEKAGGEAALENITPYITSKFNNFTANDYMRPIVGQIKSAINFRKLMDEGKILLVNLSKGRLGDINANLLGMIIVGKILNAALGRVDIVQEERRDFYLYIDEFQNFTTDSIAVILSEARKYRLNLTIAHQFINQLDEKIRDAVFGNVGTIISFRVGPGDAEFLVKNFEPVFTVNDLVNIDNFNAYIKPLVNGEVVKPFNIKTLMAEKFDSEKAKKLKEFSKITYGRDRKEVEMEIYQRLRF